jgi:hypothetical protein
MKAAALLVIIALTASSVLAQEPAPIHESIARAALDAAEQTSPRSKISRESGGRSALFWSGVALGIAGVATSALGLTVLRTEDSSTGNAPVGTYQACVAQRDSNPIYAGSQCGVLKGKNLKLLWGGVALGGVGAALMIRGSNTSAEISPTEIGLFHHLHF